MAALARSRSAVRYDLKGQPDDSTAWPNTTMMVDDAIHTVIHFPPMSSADRNQAKGRSEVPPP